MSARVRIDDEIGRLDPHYRIAELEREVLTLRHQRDSAIRSLTIEQASSGFAFELIGRGIRPPGGMRFADNGDVARD